MNRNFKIILKESPLIFLLIISAVVTGLVYFQGYIKKLQTSTELIEITSLSVNEYQEIIPLEVAFENQPSSLDHDNPFYEGINLLIDDKHEEGVAFLEKINSDLIKPEWSADVLNPWGEALITLKEYEKAARLLERVPESSSGKARSSYLTGLAYYYLDQYEKAADAYLYALEKLPGYYSASFNLGTLYLHINKPDESIRWLKIAADSSGGKRKAKAYYNLGLAYSRMALYVSSSDAYQKAISFNPSENRARLNLARLKHNYLDESDDSIELYNEVILLEPSNVTAVIELSRIFIENEDLLKAEELLNTVLEQNPESVQSREDLSSILFNLNRIDESEKHLHWIIEHGDISARALFLMGRIEYSRRNYKSAKEHYDRAIEICDKCYKEAWNNLGLVLMALGDVPGARDAYDHALILDQKFVKARYNLGLAWLEEGNENNALENFELVLKDDPDHVSALYNIAVILGHQGKPSLAVNIYLKVLEKDPDNRKARLNLANSYKQSGELDKAIEHYSMVASLNPSYTSAWFNLALAYKEAGNFKESEKAYLKTLSLEYENSSYHNNLAVLYVDEGMYEDAEAHYLDAIAGDSSNSQYVYNLALLYKKTGKVGDAYRELKKAVKINSTYIQALTQLGELERKDKKYSDASATYSRLIELEPDENEHLYNRGKSYYYSKKYNSAEKDFKYLLEISPDDPWAWYYLGKVYQKTDRTSDSDIALFNAAASDPAMSNYIVDIITDEPDSPDLIKKLFDQNPSSELQFHLAKALYSQKEYKEAENEIIQLIDKQYKLPEISKLYVKILEKQERFYDAIDVWKRILEFDGEKGSIYYRIALLYKKTDSIQELENTLKKSVSFNPLHIKSWNLLGESYYERKEYKLASDAFESSIKNGGKSAELYTSFGKALYRKKEYEEAYSWFKKALELKEDSWIHIWEARAASRTGRTDIAVEIYKKIIELTPDFIQSYIGVGDVYRRKKDYENALEWYLKALDINPVHDYSRRKAEQMKSLTAK